MSTAFDFTPLYSSMIGVDRMVDLVETALRSPASAGYPPYDIEKTGQDDYRISLAVAGFGPSDLEITAEPNLLVIKGRKASDIDQNARTFLHQGLAQRAFERRFELADHVVVKDAAYAHGVLSIDLAREVPEALKPRQIPIGGGADRPALTLAPDKTRKAA
ncbi:Hsp20 family protein [Caulobacter endophyticus]|uniref:Heat-shock protein n=1 Tax=Caulobacter endophyticus TaxID=2172652 RepID=A0A2T9JI80_9CAUL|nr:Hsp20 family protein [Caulobacter endophyticus]PVM83394.1 heat-shock protein [Caulobacter endophyticus]